jgi:hypothetical protein
MGIIMPEGGIVKAPQATSSSEAPSGPQKLEAKTQAPKEAPSPFAGFTRTKFEEGLLGILLYPAPQEVAREIFSRVRPEFFKGNRALYFAVLKDAYERGVWPLDPTLVVDEANKRSGGKLEKPLSEVAALEDWANQITTPQIWPEYANRLIDLVYRERLKEALQTTDPNDEEAVERLQTKLLEIAALKVETSETVPAREPNFGEDAPPAVPEIIEELLPEAHIALLGGKRASFKSWVGCYLALVLATGARAFGQFQARQSKVLLIDEENGPEELERRLWKLARGLGQKPEPGMLKVVSLWGFSFADERKLAMLEHCLAQEHPKIVVFDVLASVLGGLEENDAAAIRDFFSRRILPLAAKYGCCFIFLHHLRKSQPFTRDELDEFRGSSELVNVSDVIWVVRKQEGDKLEFKPLKNRRGGLVEPFIVEVEEDAETSGLRFIYGGSALESAAAVETCQEALLEWFGEHEDETMKTAIILEAMRAKGYTKSTIDRALATLVGTGALVKPKRGFYRLGKGKVETGTLGI